MGENNNKKMFDYFPRWLILKKIFEIRQNNFNSYRKLASELNINQSNPYYRKVLFYLINYGAVVLGNINGRNQELEINYSKIRDLLEDSIIFISVEDFIHERGAFKIT